MKTETHFDFKELNVWQKAMEFADQVIHLTENLNTNRNHYRLIEQLESSSTSVAQNIAEGKGRFSKKEYIHFLYIARGSIYETVTLLNLFAKRKWINEEKLTEMAKDALEITSMIKGLINYLRKSMS